MIHQQFPNVTQFFKGAKTPKAPAPIPPPSPTTAYENFQKSETAMRQRRARGFGQSIIGGYADIQSQSQNSRESFLKSLLGQ